jgi:hypothetical protein
MTIGMKLFKISLPYWVCSSSQRYIFPSWGCKYRAWWIHSVESTQTTPNSAPSTTQPVLPTSPPSSSSVSWWIPVLQRLINPGPVQLKPFFEKTELRCVVGEVYALDRDAKARPPTADLSHGVRYGRESGLRVPGRLNGPLKVWPKISRRSGPKPTSFSKFIQLCATCNKAAECIFMEHDWFRSHRLLKSVLEHAKYLPAGA